MLNQSSRSNLPEVVDTAVLVHSVIKSRSALEDAVGIVEHLERRIVDVGREFGYGLVVFFDRHLIQRSDFPVYGKCAEDTVFLSESGNLVGHGGVEQIVRFHLLFLLGQSEISAFLNEWELLELTNIVGDAVDMHFDAGLDLLLLKGLLCLWSVCLLIGTLSAACCQDDGYKTNS